MMSITRFDSGSSTAIDGVPLVYTPAVAAATAMKIAGWKTPMPGRMTISMPAKPTATAAHRRQPTGSFRNSPAMAVTIKGAMKVTAVASASGTCWMVRMKKAAEQVASTPRPIWMTPSALLEPS